MSRVRAVPSTYMVEGIPFISRLEVRVAPFSRRIVIAHVHGFRDAQLVAFPAEAGRQLGQAVLEATRRLDALEDDITDGIAIGPAGPGGITGCVNGQ